MNGQKKSAQQITNEMAPNNDNDRPSSQPEVSLEYPSSGQSQSQGPSAHTDNAQGDLGFDFDLSTELISQEEWDAIMVGPELTSNEDWLLQQPIYQDYNSPQIQIHSQQQDRPLTGDRSVNSESANILMQANSMGLLGSSRGLKRAYGSVEPQITTAHHAGKRSRRVDHGEIDVDNAETSHGPSKPSNPGLAKHHDSGYNSTIFSNTPNGQRNIQPLDVEHIQRVLRPPASRDEPQHATNAASIPIAPESAAPVLLHATWEAAKLHRERPRWQVDSPWDPSMPRSTQDRQRYIADVRDAMLDTRNVVDREKKGVHNWINRKYDDADVEAWAWRIIEALDLLHTIGCPIPSYAFTKAGFVNEALSYRERFDLVCDVLRRRKSYCTSILHGDELRLNELVANPCEVERRALQNEKGNAKRQVQITTGKMALQQGMISAPLPPPTAHSKGRSAKNQINSRTLQENQTRQAMRAHTHARRSKATARSLNSPTNAVPPISIFQTSNHPQDPLRPSPTALQNFSMSPSPREFVTDNGHPIRPSEIHPTTSQPVIPRLRHQMGHASMQPIKPQLHQPIGPGLQGAVSHQRAQHPDFTVLGLPETLKMASNSPTTSLRQPMAPISYDLKGHTQNHRPRLIDSARIERPLDQQLPDHLGVSYPFSQEFIEEPTSKARERQIPAVLASPIPDEFSVPGMAQPRHMVHPLGVETEPSFSLEDGGLYNSILAGTHHYPIGENSWSPPRHDHAETLPSLVKAGNPLRNRKRSREEGYDEDSNRIKVQKMHSADGAGSEGQPRPPIRRLRRNLEHPIAKTTLPPSISLSSHRAPETEDMATGEASVSQELGRSQTPGREQRREEQEHSPPGAIRAQEHEIDVLDHIRRLEQGLIGQQPQDWQILSDSIVDSEPLADDPDEIHPLHMAYDHLFGRD
ncbi:hypothetical protein AOQ84DRAFT_363074 [Glonium stellatum]|uniref:Uncharacterized protein n=1 Tax=Glonium stellatum TaxID=574774 RepID=A0A8E2JU20_9PEZI|nr:hypothetical protein AOQ84DRAFT_363074 [Glonium stellatum]